MSLVIWYMYSIMNPRDGRDFRQKSPILAILVRHCSTESPRSTVPTIMMVARVCLLAFVAACSAQDPADGWMAYAVGTVPDGTHRTRERNARHTDLSDSPRRRRPHHKARDDMDGWCEGEEKLCILLSAHCCVETIFATTGCKAAFKFLPPLIHVLYPFGRTPTLHGSVWIPMTTST